MRSNKLMLLPLPVHQLIVFLISYSYYVWVGRNIKFWPVIQSLPLFFNEQRQVNKGGRGWIINDAHFIDYPTFITTRIVNQ